MGIFRAWSGWREYRKLPADWQNIVIYSESGQDWHYFEALIISLNLDLQKKVTYVTSDSEDPGLGRDHPLFKAICIPEGFFLTLHFNMQKADVVVLTMMDLDNLQLKKSINPVHYIYLFHSLGSTHMVDHANSYDAYDSLFCVGPHHVAELRKRESMQGLGARNLFEYGHPRLENLLEAADSCQRDMSGAEAGSATKPVVLIAPTWGEHSIFNTCGEELIGLLLDAGYHVIARPHYQTLLMTPEVLERLKTSFSGHENFEYQDRMGESDSLFRSDILICDWSAMAIEYALGLEKPVLFLDLPRRVRNPDWKALGIEPLEASFRELAGDIVAPQHLDEVPEKIADLLEKRQVFRQTMKDLRTQVVFNIGNSIELGAREIGRLADEKAHERQAREKSRA
jgi:YidC/Oxa1 family membrane protein insertase